MKTLTPFKTKDDLYYSFIGYFSENYVIAHPLYYPQLDGTRTLNNKNYEKFSKKYFLKSEIYTKYPSLKEIDYWSVKIPLNDIAEIFDPLDSFKKLMVNRYVKNDERYSFINDFRLFLNEELGLMDIGVLGSYSAGLNTIYSDIDLVIYCDINPCTIIKYLSTKVTKNHGKCMSTSLAHSYATRYNINHPEYSIRYLQKMFLNDVTKLYIGGKKLSIILCEKKPFIKDKLSIIKPYRNEKFIGKIICTEKSHFYPRRYVVLNLLTNKIVNIISYQWFFKGLNFDGDLVSISCDFIIDEIYILNKKCHFIKNC